MGETEEDGAKPLRQPKKDGSQKPIRQAENEIPVFALFAILANMDPRTMSELIAKKMLIALLAIQYSFQLCECTVNTYICEERCNLTCRADRLRFRENFFACRNFV